MSAVPATRLSSADGRLTSESIERTLRDLWREMAESGSEATQVRMLNLIVYLPEPPSPEVHRMINAVAMQHPGRTITLLHEEGAPRAEATLACRVEAGQPHVCGEQITLHGSAAGHPLHSLAVALLLAGLPVTVWWHGPVDFDDHVFRKLVQVADRIIFDSRWWPDAASALPRLARAAGEWGPAVRFSDLQWVHLTSWRRLIALAFDVPAARAALPHLSQVVVEYGASAGPGVAPLLLAGWLASRLGWEIDEEPLAHDDTGYVALLRRASASEGTLPLVLRRGMGDKAIAGVEMRADGAGKTRVALELSADGLHVTTHIEVAGFTPLVQVAHIHAREPADLLGDELALNRTDPVYAAALHAAVQLVERLALPG